MKHALELDSKNGNTMWTESITKEKNYIEVYFVILDDDTPPPVGHQKIECHMIFDVNMEDFLRKARFVHVGHKTEPPATITYEIVVSQEAFHLCLVISAQNDV